MKFATYFASALTFGLAIASPLEQRQNAPTVVARIGDIGTAIKKLNATLNTFKPYDPVGIPKALIIQQQSTDIDNAIKSATTAAKKINGQLSSPDGDSVVIAVLDLFPLIQQVLANIVTKKKAFATAVFAVGDLSKTVRATLVTLRTDTNTFGQTLIPKLDDVNQGDAPGVLASILALFDQAIQAYDKCNTGTLCLPPIPTLPLPRLPRLGH